MPVHTLGRMADTAAPVVASVEATRAAVTGVFESSAAMPGNEAAFAEALDAFERAVRADFLDDDLSKWRGY